MSVTPGSIARIIRGAQHPASRLINCSIGDTDKHIFAKNGIRQEYLKFGDII